MTSTGAGVPMISMDDVQFSYDGATSVLAIPRLEIGAGLTLVVGPNGSGKSTLLRMAAGVDRPSHGTVRILGVDLWRDEVAGRKHLAYVPEHPELTPYATILEVLHLVARLRDLPASAAAEALDRVGLVDVAWRTVRELSMGQRRRALLAAALIGEPRVVILDEPMETMDAATRTLVLEWVLARRHAGAAILLATHDTVPFEGIVERVLAVSDGTIVRDGQP